MDKPNFTPEFLASILEKTLKTQTRYFELQSYISENKVYMDAMMKHLLKLKIEDQVQILESLVNTCKIAEKLCRKYNIPVGGNEDATD